MKDYAAGYRYHLLAEVNSTNMHAMDKLYAGLAGNGDVFITEYQTAGRGQRGKNWNAGRGESILMSILYHSTRFTTSQTFRISAAVAVGVKNFLEALTHTPFEIKWPNDLYQGDRKAGGILIENVVQQGVLKWTVIGIGINVNQQAFPPELPNPVSISQVTGQTYNCTDLARRLVAFVDEQWQKVTHGHWKDVLQSYNDALYARGEVKKLKLGSVVIPCRIKSVDQHGHLVAGENDEWHFTHGQVEWMLQEPL